MLEKQIVDMLNQLSAKLGVASDKIWEWALLQVKVDLLRDMALGLPLLGVVVLCGFIAYKISKDEDVKLSDDPFCASIGLMGVFIVLSIITLWDVPQYILNPEYAAFKNILGELSQLK